MYTNAFGQLQQIGRALMLPVAILPAAGLLLAFGTQLEIGILQHAGDIVFKNLALIFAIGVAIGLTKEEGAAALAAVIGYLVMNTTLGEMAKTFHVKTADVLGIPTIPMGVFGGIIIGVIAAMLFNRFHNIELPSYLGFFGGKRFVPIITAFVSFFLGVLFFYIWPTVQSGIDQVSHFVIHQNGASAAFIFGTIERALIPFGLHHIFYAPFWFEFGSYVNSAGEVVKGDFNRFFAHDPTAGTFLSGKFAFMIFGLPAAALAIYQESKPEKKKLVGGIMLSAGLTSFLTGITEPIEFSFLFVAPLLFGIHCIFAGISYMIMALLGVKAGCTFSGGIIDLMMFWKIDTKPWLIIPVGCVFAIVYYIGFRFAIRKWNLHTPGREEEENLPALRIDQRGDLASHILEALGKARNISKLDACITRLRVSVLDPSKVHKGELKKLGASGVLEMGNHFQVIFGTKSDLIKEQMKLLLNGEKEEETKSECIKASGICNEESSFISPMTGRVISITEVEDQVFSEKLMGDGFAIYPTEGTVVSPVDGEIINLFPTKHAVAIRSSDGQEILIHVGINTVTLEGVGFTSYVSSGEGVIKGQKILDVDLTLIQEQGISICTPIVFTNLTEDDCIKIEKEHIKIGEDGVFSLMKVQKDLSI